MQQYALPHAAAGASAVQEEEPKIQEIDTESEGDEKSVPCTKRKSRSARTCNKGRPKKKRKLAAPHEKKEGEVPVCPTVIDKHTTSTNINSIDSDEFTYPTNGDIYGRFWCVTCAGNFGVRRPCRCASTFCGYMGEEMMCDFVGTPDEVRAHRVEEHGVHQCAKCDASFGTQRELRDHSRKHLPGNTTTCMLCGDVILATEALKHLEKKHRLFPFNENNTGSCRPWACPFCATTFSAVESFAKHVSECKSLHVAHKTIAPLIVDGPMNPAVDLE